jgi:uncharacterized protein
LLSLFSISLTIDEIVVNIKFFKEYDRPEEYASTMVTRQIICPTCKKSVSWEGNPNRPFCSERCKLIDLGAWAQERYSIAGGDNDDKQPGDLDAGEEGEN